MPSAVCIVSDRSKGLHCFCNYLSCFWSDKGSVYGSG